MIFVTVGTHEQPFNRLVKYMDDLKGKGVLEEEVIIQTGFSTYEPIHCTWSKFLPYQKMTEYAAGAHIVVTHGGPSSIFMPLQSGKIPIVVPRQKKYGEHVNDHQVEFAKQTAQRQGNIIVAEDVDALEELLVDYDNLIRSMPSGLHSNNAAFNEKFEKIVDELWG